MTVARRPCRRVTLPLVCRGWLACLQAPELWHDTAVELCPGGRASTLRRLAKAWLQRRTKHLVTVSVVLRDRHATTIENFRCLKNC